MVRGPKPQQRHSRVELLALEGQSPKDHLLLPFAALPQLLWHRLRGTDELLLEDKLPPTKFGKKATQNEHMRKTIAFHLLTSS